MGAPHTIRAPASWELFTGERMAARNPVLEQVANTHRDTPGAWARLVNDLYEYARPPIVVDRYCPSLTTTSTSYPLAASARYMHDPDAAGTDAATASEGYVFSVYARCTAGQTGRVQLSGVSSSAELDCAGDGTWKWYHHVTLIGQTFTGALLTEGAAEIELRTKVVAPGPGTFDVGALMVRWYAGRTELPDGPYDTAFLPMPVMSTSSLSLTTELHPVAVELMRRLLRDLDQLRRRRASGGQAMSSWTPGGIPDRALDDVRLRMRISQPEYAQQLRVWLWSTDDAAADIVGWPVTGLGFTGFPAAGGWLGRTFEVPLWRGPEPKELELVVTDGTSPVVLGCSAYWLPITRSW